MSKRTYTVEFEANYIKGLAIKDKYVAIRVEGEDDEYFWESVFKKCRPNQKVLILVESKYYPSEGTRGKHILLELAQYADKKLIVCIDSDYDYILQNEIINSNPYVLQTYADSIENIICNPNRLNEICCKSAAVDKIDFDFERFFEEFSKIVYPLFLVSIKQEKIRKLGELSEDEKLFDRKEFANYVSLLGVVDISNNAEKVLHDLTERVMDKGIAITDDEKEELEANLTSLGINESSIFWHIRGKNILNSITKHLLKSIVNQTVSEQKQAIVDTTVNKSDIPSNIEKYHSKRQKWEDLLITNYPINNHPFFNQIQTDINTIFN